VLKSETLSLSGGVHRCFKRSTRKKKTCDKRTTKIMMVMMTIIIIIIIIITGIVSRSLQKYLETIPGQHSIDSLQKTAILGTSHIIRKVLQAET
jgi:hypothetical protein